MWQACARCLYTHKHIYNIYAAAAKSLQLCPTLCDPIEGQPTRLPRPWDSPGKNTGVGCHFLLQCMKVESESEVTQSCPTLSMDCSPPGSSVHGIFQARVLEWGAIAFSDNIYTCIKMCFIFCIFTTIFAISYVSSTLLRLFVNHLFQF